MSDPFETVRPVGTRREPTRAAAAAVERVAQHDSPATTVPGLDLEQHAPATVDELARMLSAIVRQMFSAAMSDEKKSYEREHLSRAAASVADKLADLLAKPQRPAQASDAQDTRPEALSLALRIAESMRDRNDDDAATMRADARPEDAS